MADEATKPKQRRLTSFSTKASDIESDSAAQSSASSDSYSSVSNETTKSTEMKKTVKREFRDIWLKEYPWLSLMGIECLVKIVSLRVKTTLLCQVVPTLDIQPWLDIFHQVNIKQPWRQYHFARRCTFRLCYKFYFKKEQRCSMCVKIYLLALKRRASYLKTQITLKLHRLHGCSFPDELEVGSASYTSSQAAEERQDAIASVLVNSRTVLSYQFC